MNTNVDLILSGPELLKSLRIDSFVANNNNCQQIDSLNDFK